MLQYSKITYIIHWYVDSCYITTRQRQRIILLYYCLMLYCCALSDAHLQYWLPTSVEYINTN